MAFKYLTLEYETDNEQLVVLRINGIGVEDYERQTQESKFTGKKQPVMIANPAPPKRPLHEYLNKLGKRGWEVCASSGQNLIVLKKLS